MDVFHTPRYAILSHCWGDNELSFKDYRKGQNLHWPDYRKIVDCCRFARQHEHNLLWVDTVCIDKRSSAELSEGKILEGTAIDDKRTLTWQFRQSYQLYVLMVQTGADLLCTSL